MSSYRDAILEGTRVATELLFDLDLRSRLKTSGGDYIDVVGEITKLGIPLLFRPMDKLLGACVRVSAETQGILVTSERSRQLQRLTAAHELGHIHLKHEGSLDAEQDIGFLGRANKHANLNEVAAEAFATEFLAPKWLIRHHCTRHQWSVLDCQEPVIVYQLSLRLGISYLATCWSLLSNDVITDEAAAGLSKVEPKESKRALLAGVELKNSWADVWQLGKSDDAAVLNAGPDDVMTLVLPEHAAGGYEWTWPEPSEMGLKVLMDESAAVEGDAVGGVSERRLAFTPPPRRRTTIALAERRPWEGESIDHLTISCLTFGRALPGLPLDPILETDDDES